MNIIITGATGMLGKGIVLEALEDSRVKRILTIGRSSLTIDHPKLVQMKLSNLADLHLVEHPWEEYDACFYTMGVSAAGMNEEKYTKLTYDMALGFARTLHTANPNMTFNYISGMGTDSSEKGRQMWARVKGKTENDLLQLGFKKAHMFRPGFIIPERGLKSRTALYRRMYTLMSPFLPLIKRMKSVITTTELSLSMLNSVQRDAPTIINPKDIHVLAQSR